MINKEDVLEALQTVKSSDSRDVVTSGIVSSIIVKGDSVGFALEVDASGANNMEDLRKSCEDAVKKLSGVKKVTAVLTTTREAAPEQAKKTNIENSKKKPVPGIKNIILVASGKGGVGKSTIAVNLAVALARTGYNIGVLDADIYGPSIPKMLHAEGKPEVDEFKRLTPYMSGNIQTMSMGNLVDPERAAVWRGPMATKALYQLFHGVSWNNVDYLIVDMPPGTGDIQLSIAENFPIKGAILVSTPQEIALLDVKKAADMFNKVNIPIIGVIENMSYFEDPVSKNKNYIFGKHGAEKFAQVEGIPFLGEVPLVEKIREGGDKGEPVAAVPGSDIGNRFDEFALRIVHMDKKVETS